MSFGNLFRQRHTLAFRLTLWYACLFSISFCLAFLFFYLLITSVLQERTDQELLNQAGTFSSILTVKGVNALKRVAILEAQAAGEKKIFFRLLTRYGETFSSSNMSYWQKIDVGGTAVKQIIAGEKHIFETILIPERKFKVRILYKIIGHGIILQLGYSLEHYTKLTETFRKVFVLTISFFIVFAALIGWFMAKQALSGLGEVTRIARTISGGALEKRVPVKNKADEIDLLATTFNQMLDRIQSLVTGIKEMSDNIAHDLKSPVTRIRGTAEITLTTGSTIDEYKDMAASAIEDCDRLLDMINTMLVISETEAGAGSLKSEDMDISHVVRDACDLFHPLAEDKCISMISNLPDKCNYRGDIRMIQRMIANLLDNAIKYTQHKGTVEVMVSRDDTQSICIAVRDTGIGISEKDIPHIFERFYRCDFSRHQTGIGLGLSLAQAIAQAHGGNIEVKANSNNGTVFTVRLPNSLKSI